MSQLSTHPAYSCLGCGKWGQVTHLATAGPDPDASKLRGLMKGLRKIAKCKECLKRDRYMAENPLTDRFYYDPARDPLRVLRLGD